jgi:hypothetical protein
MAQRIKHNILFLLNIKNESYACSCKEMFLLRYAILTVFVAFWIIFCPVPVKKKGSILSEKESTE